MYVCISSFVVMTHCVECCVAVKEMKGHTYTDVDRLQCWLIGDVYWRPWSISCVQWWLTISGQKALIRTLVGGQALVSWCRPSSTVNYALAAPVAINAAQCVWSRRSGKTVDRIASSSWMSRPLAMRTYRRQTDERTDGIGRDGLSSLQIIRPASDDTMR